MKMLKMQDLEKLAASDGTPGRGFTALNGQHQLPHAATRPKKLAKPDKSRWVWIVGIMLMALIVFKSLLPTGTPTPSQGNILTPDMAASLCASSGCSASQFGPLSESNGVVNAAGVHFNGGGICYPFVLPSWVQMDYWDGASAHYDIRGETTVTHVCEASLRNLGSE